MPPIPKGGQICVLKMIFHEERSIQTVWDEFITTRRIL